MQRIILPFSFVFPFLHTLVTSSHRIPGLLMRGGKKKDSSVFEVAHTFYSIFLFFFCSSRSTLAFGVNRIRGNSKMREASNEPQTGVVAAEDRFIAPITVCLFFFLLDPLRLNDVSLYHATRKTFLCFAFSCPLLNRASGNIFPRNIERKGFSSATDIFAI